MSRPNSAPTAAKPFHNFDGQPTGQQEGRRAGQPGNRRTAVHWDQHGRQWWSSIEIRSGTSTGMIEPNFHAPWYPDQQYLVENPANVTQLFIDYRRMATDRKVATDEYHTGAVQLSDDKKWPTPKYGDYPSEIIEAKGRPPRSHKLVVAAWQGNPWILGESETPDPRLEQLVAREKPARSVNIQDFTEDFGAESYAAATGGDVSQSTPAAIDGRRFAFGADAADRSFIEELDAETAAIANANPDDFEGEDATALLGSVEEEEKDENIESMLSQIDEDDLDDTHDAAAMGGRTVKPQNAERAERQAPRRPGASAQRKGGGEKPKRPTLADGAAPVVGN